MDIPDDTARFVFDIAVQSMDFASGFLDYEEVDHLRAYAEAIGVDPELATPEYLKQRYRELACPGHQWGDAVIDRMLMAHRTCPICGAVKTYKSWMPEPDGP